MNRVLAQYVVESLRVIGPFDAALERLTAFSQRDWRRTLSWLDDSGLALYLLDRVNRSGLRKVLPTSVEARLLRNLASNQRRLAEMKDEFGSLNRRFDAAGIEYAVLKGFALIPDYCPEAGLRSQYDYDYLVGAGSLRKAREVLEAAGYSQKVKSPGFEKMGESLFAAEPLSLPAPDDNFYSTDIPRTVELHLGLWESHQEMISLEVPNDVLGRKSLAYWEGLRFPVLADDDALVFQALHAFQHSIDFWCRPSCFLEIAYFIALRRADASFWERFRARLEGYKYLFRVVGLVFSMAQLLFKAPIPADVSDWTTHPLSGALSLWVQHHGRNWALACFPGSKLSLLVHREFIEDPVLWRQVSWSRLFPVHRPGQVVESGSPTVASQWLATWHQAYYVLFRLKFHLNALLSYAWELPRWKLKLRRFQRDRR